MPVCDDSRMNQRFRQGLPVRDNASRVCESTHFITWRVFRTFVL